MAGTLHKFRTAKARLDQERANKLRQHILAFDEFDLPEEAVRAVILAIDKQTATARGWTFVMLSPSQNAAVVGWLRHNSARPGVAMQVWAEMLTGLRIDTGEIMVSREELSKRVEAPLTSVSQVLTELEGIGAISRRRERIEGTRGPGRLTIFVNPNVATILKGKARDKAQQATPPVKTDMPPRLVSTAGKKPQQATPEGKPIGCTPGNATVRHLVAKGR